ncbi:hypothetical protein [Effusibacillus consociatus]|uniref:Uncharacterized protein n=1 Tax=Effusibacillus consociatus TaxID=1117041 RepID=A0ABV9PZQ9_9BACL
MNRNLFKGRIVRLLLAGILICTGAGWGYYHFVMTPQYDSVTNATRL